MEVTKMSSRGQVVIPEKVRKGIKVGAPFVVSRIDEMIIFKPVKGLSDDEKKELKEVNKIWDEIDEGKATTYTEKNFFKAMKKW